MKGHVDVVNAVGCEKENSATVFKETQEDYMTGKLL